MKPANLLRWYPRAWRERYGEELLALIQDTLDEGRPTWRLRLGVIWGGMRERGHQAGHAVRAAVKRWAGTGNRPLILTVGLVVASIPWNLKALPQARGWQATAALAVLAGILAFTGVCVLASALVAAPAFVAFLREGGWPKIRRRVAWAAGATVAAGGALAGLVLGQRSMSFAQLSQSWAYFIGVAATGLALVVALGLWASAAAATAKHLKLAPRARAAQLLLAAVTLTAALAIVSGEHHLARGDPVLARVAGGRRGQSSLGGRGHAEDNRAGRPQGPTPAGNRRRGDDDQPVRSADTRPPPGLTIWGAAWQAAKSALIAPAVCSRNGRYSPSAWRTQRLCSRRVRAGRSWGDPLLTASGRSGKASDQAARDRFTDTRPPAAW